MNERCPPLLPVLLVVLAGACALAVAGGGAKPAVFVPDPAAEGAAPYADGVWSGGDTTWRARLKRLDDAERTRFVREKMGIAVDPFGKTPGATEGFDSYRLEIENVAAPRLIFQSQNCRLLASDRENRYPLDLPTIEIAFARIDQPMPDAFREMRRFLFDGEVVLRAGEKAEGLLVYRPVNPKVKSYSVEIVLTTSGGSVVGFKAPYVRGKR